MKFVSAVALALAVAACAPAPQQQAKTSDAPQAPAQGATLSNDGSLAAAVDALAVTYEVKLTEGNGKTCSLTLDKDIATAPETRIARPGPGCHATLPELEAVVRWTANGAGSLSLQDKDNTVLGDFSPVQDVAVYLRGSIGGQLYELKPPQ